MTLTPGYGANAKVAFGSSPSTRDLRDMQNSVIDHSFDQMSVFHQRRGGSISVVPSQNFAKSVQLPDIHATERKKLQGYNFDQIYTKNKEEFGKIQEENKVFKKENNQLKNLNHKLIDRIDFL